MRAAGTASRVVEFFIACVFQSPVFFNRSCDVRFFH